jgi:hypothetical protein
MKQLDLFAAEQQCVKLLLRHPEQVTKVLIASLGGNRQATCVLQDYVLQHKRLDVLIAEDL